MAHSLSAAAAMAGAASTTTAAPTPFSTTSYKKSHFACVSVRASHEDSNDEKSLNRRTLSLGLGGVALGLNGGEWSARAAARRPPPSPQEEKKDPNLSGLQAKVVASKKRKEAMKEEMAKLRQRGKSHYQWRTNTSVPAKVKNWRDDDWFAALGRSCIHMTWSDRGAISLEGLGLQVVDKVKDAEFILAHGTEALGHPSGVACPMKLEELESILEQCATKKIPMVVANPDFVTVEARALRVMPGTLAAKYEELGGEVKWMGKPDKIIYESAMAMAGVDASDSIAVGDSLHHDIKGANAAGIQSVFTTGGIHATELGLNCFGEIANSSSVQALASKYGAYPSYVIPAFTW
uniref:Uncharacterized protein n=1 Tax=Cannabis sativa TaxID=3483 RepID=A0A803P0J4_CANSA